MRRISRRVSLAFLLLLLTASPQARAQSLPGWGRVSLFGMAQSVKYDDGTTRSFTEATGTFTLKSKTADDGGFEYAFDVRGSSYPGTDGRDTRGSIYDAWVGGRLLGGSLLVRAGQMYLTDLGGLGSVGGALLEYRPKESTPVGRLRFGLFGGLDPKPWDIGYASGVRKGGAYVGLEGENNRRDVLGWVVVRDSGLTERSVLTTTNFLPIGKTFFLYQAAEYDLQGPGGVGNGGLNYFFANARFTPSQAVEVMATYHRGRSIDTRSITQDILAGRPVDQKSLDGFLYESYGGRIQVEVVPNVRVFGGYYRDTNNYDSTAANRYNLGLWAANVLKSGFDFTLSDNRVQKPGGDYDAWYASLGHLVGTKVYLSVDYSTSLSTILVTDSGGITVVNRPRTKRYSVSGTWNIDRHFSIFGTAEQLRDDNSRDNRGLLGLSYRF